MRDHVRPFVGVVGRVAALLVGVAGSTAHAQSSYYWTGTSGSYAFGGTGTWNAGTPWRLSGTAGTLSSYSSGTNAVFFSGTGGTLTIASGTVQVNRINVASTTTGTYTIGSGTLQFVGGTNGITMAPGKTLVITPSVQQGTGAGTLDIVGGGTVQFGATNRAYAGNLQVSGTGTTLKYVGTNGLDNATTSSGITASNGATAEINSTNNYRTTFALGSSGSAGGTLKLGNAAALVTQGGFSLSVSGTSKSTVLSTLTNATTTSGSYGAISGNGGSNGTFTVGSTGDTSGVDLEYSAVFRNGTLAKSGSGTMRLAPGFMITQTGSSDLSTFVATGVSVNVNAGTLLNEGTIYSIANVNGGVLKTTGTAGSFDQVNVTSGTFEVSRTTGLFRTLSGTTYASGNGALNPRGGTIRYVGVSTDYSGQMGSLGGVASTIDTNGQTVTFASALSGTGGLTKAGAGTLTLSTTNGHSGVTSVTGGTLVLDSPLGLQNSPFSTSGTGVLQLPAAATAITLGGLAGTNAFAAVNYGTVSAVTLNPQAGVTATLSGPLGDGAAGMTITKTGSGTQVFSGTTSYTGVTTVSAGTLRFATTASLYGGVTSSWSAANLVTGSGATTAFSAGGAGEFTEADITSLAALGGAADGFLAGSSVGIDTSSAGGSWTFGGSIANPNAGVNTLGLVKLGSGTLALTAAQAYTGPTTVVAGALLLDAASSLVTSSGVTVSGGSLRLGGDSVLGGIPVTLAGGGVSSADGSPRTISSSVTLTSNATLGDATANGPLTLAGPVDLGGQFRTFTLASDATISGTITNGGIAKTGAGVLALTGVNTYSGTTRVNDGGGVLRVDAASALPAASVIASVKTGTNTGSLVLNSPGTSTFTNAFANFSSSNGLPNGGTPNIRNLQGDNTVSGNMTITAGGGNGVNLASDGGLLTISGTLQNNGGSGSRPFFLGGSGVGVVSGPIVTGATSGSNATSIIKNGSGTWSLTNAANSFGGGVSILDGVLDVASLADAGVASATGTGGTISFIGQGTSGALRYTGAAAQSTNRTVSIGASGGAIDSSGVGALAFTGSFTTASPTSFNLIYTSGSTVAINTNSAAPDVVVGMTVTSTSSVLPAGTTITAINGNAYTLSAAALTTSTVSASFSNPASRTFVLKGTNAGANTIASRLVDNSGTAALAVTKQGTGRWILTGSNSYTGPTTVSGGTLLVNGNQSAATGSLLVDALATLGGTGTAGGAMAVSAAGRLSPGASLGILTTGSDVSFADGAFYDFELDTTLLSADLLVANGSLSLPTTGTANLSLIDLGTPAAVPLGTVLSLVNYRAGWNGGLFAFAGLPLAEGGSFTSGSNTWQITYSGTAGGANAASLPGSFVNLTAVVPEPTAIALLAGAAMAAVVMRSRRRPRLVVGQGTATASLLVLIAFAHATTAEAQLTYYWGGASGTYAVGGPGAWNSTAVNQWRFGDPSTGALMVYSNGTNAVYFSGTGGALSIASGTVQVNRINVASTATGTYTIGSGTLQFVGGTNGITMAPGKTLVITPNVQQGSGASTLDIVGGGTVQFGATNRAYAGNLQVSGTGTTVKFVATNGLDSGSVSSGVTAFNGGTAEINSTNNMRTTINLGVSGSSGGTLKLGFAGGNGALVAQSGFNLAISGTSKSTVLSTANNTTTASGSYAAIGGNAGSNATFTVGSTGDASGVDLEYSAVFRNGTMAKAGAGTMRLNRNFMITQTGSSDLSTFVATGVSVNVNAGTLLNEGTIYSIANVNGGVLKTTGTSGSFDQVNVTSGTFEVSRTTGLFRTLSGTTYASGNGALNPRGGTIRYVGVSTDYSGQMGNLGGVASTIDTNGQTVAFGSGLSGTGGLTKAGAGTLTLGAANTYSGVTTAVTGTLVIGQGLALQNSRLDTSGSGAVQIAGTVIGGLTIGGLSGGGDFGLGSANINALTLNLQGGTATYTANLGSAVPAMSLTKTGSGLQVLSGTAGYTGPIAITGGGLYFTTAAALFNGNTAAWTAANLVTGSGGTLAVNVGGTGEVSTADAAMIASLGGATDGFLPGSTLGLGVTDPAATVTYTASLADPNGGANSRGFVKLGPGTLSLTAPATYTGSTTIAGGRLVFEATSSLPTSAGVSLTGSGATLDVSAVSGTSLSLPSLSVVAGGTVLLGGKSLTFGTVGTNTIAGGVISGTGGITYTGAGVLELSGSNAFTGFGDGISLAAGSTVYLKNPFGLGDASAGTTLGDGATIYMLSSANSAPIPEPFTISGTGAQLRAGSATSYTLTGSIALPATVTMNLDTGSTITAAGAISGTGGMVKTGGGTLVLSNSTGVNTFAGGLAQTSAGGITVGMAGSQGTGPITFGAGGSGAVTFANVSGTIANDIVSVDGGSGGVTKSGAATTVLTGINTYTGTTTVANAGGELRIDNPASLPAGSVVNLPKSGTNTGALVLNTAGTNTYANTFANFASSNGLPNGGTPNIRNLQGENTVNGAMTITTGGGNGVNITSDGGRLDVAGTLQNNGGSGTRPFFFGGAGTGVVSGAILNGTISGSNVTSVVKNGPGTWSLTGAANTFTGGVTVIDGVLDVGSVADTGVPAAIGSSGAISMLGQGSSGTLRYTGATAQSTNRTLVVGASGGAIDSSGGGTLTFTGTVSSVDPTSFSLTYAAGSNVAYNLNTAAPDVVVGMTVTSATSVLPAGTTITAINGNAYTLSNQALSGTAVSASFSTVDRTLVLKGSNVGDNTISGRLLNSATGGRLAVTKQDAGRWVLSGSNTYTGATTVSGGTLALGPSASIARSARIAVSAGAALDVTALATGLVVGGSQTLGGSGTVVGSATIDAGATLAPGSSPGSLAFTGDLTWNGSGNYNWQMLSGTGSAGAEGAWDLVSVTGTLAIASTTADPFKVNVWTLSGIAPDVSGSAANFNSTQNYAWTIATAAGGITGFSADKFTVVTSATNGTGGFANAFGTGTFSVAQSGNDLNLVFTAGAAPTVITINVASGTQTQTQAGYPTLSGSIPVVKTGDGTLVLDQANTLTGSTTVQGGVLRLANATALSASRLVVVAGGTGQVAPYAATGVASLDLAGGNGLIDLTSGALTISGGMTATELVAEILEGRVDGSWAGTSGITSSTAASEVAGGTPRAVGWVDNGDGSLTAAYAAPGDTNIDWSIDILDASNFLALGKFDTGTPATWVEGDFSYDGIVDILDAADFFATGLYDAGNYNTAPGISPTPDGVGLGQVTGSGVAAVPEPATGSLVVLGAVACALGVRRRRR